MYRGTFTAIVTPFTRDDRIDEKALRALVERQIAGGVTGLVPVGTTGESPTLDYDEHIEVVRIVVDQAKKRVPVIAGTGSNGTAEAIHLTQKAKEVGADASLQVAPYYNRPTQEGLFRHFTAIADAVDLPMIVYNIPGRCAVNVENKTMLRLAKHRNIVGVKEATGIIAQSMELIREKPADFCVLSGDDNVVLPLVSVGFDGVISVASNVIPERMSAFVRMVLEDRFAEARREHYALLPFFKALFVETNPTPVKYALAKLGLIEEYYRLPICPMAPESKAVVDEAMRNMGL